MCPIAAYLWENFQVEIKNIKNEYGCDDGQAVCSFLCPEVLQTYEGTTDGRCAIRVRLLKDY
ncbi:hypothetical protein EDD73_1196 [Heliophilum fasciatum]|uniref:Uncharacterized protein n=2 Tax=Heliophilum fasciatum TaxID=35700 RepID=A0A4R2RJG6_9FIRM|nr:hypothetical protein EDD73_1196 [Heliophilum fasciatum]